MSDRKISDRTRELARTLHELFQNHQVWNAIQDALDEERREENEACEALANDFEAAAAAIRFRREEMNREQQTPAEAERLHREDGLPHGGGGAGPDQGAGT